MSDIQNACADLILTDAMVDLAHRDGNTVDEVRASFVASGAYDALYDFETGLWREGPDFFIWFHERLNKKQNET